MKYAKREARPSAGLFVKMQTNTSAMERIVINSVMDFIRKKVLLVAAVMLSGFFCAGNPASAQSSEIPGEAIDQLTLLYINHRIFPDLTVDCVPKTISQREIVGCRGVGVGRKSSVHVWSYSQGKFWSINGNARSLAQTKFSDEGLISVSPLPLPADIDVGKIVKVFSGG